MAFPLTGIENANEFYSQHYLDEVLEQDLKELFAAWQAQGAASPAARLKSMAGEYFRLRDRILKAKTLADRVALLHELAETLFPALGYELQPETVAVRGGRAAGAGVLSGRGPESGAGPCARGDGYGRRPRVSGRRSAPRRSRRSSPRATVSPSWRRWTGRRRRARSSSAIRIRRAGCCCSGTMNC